MGRVGGDTLTGGTGGEFHSTIWSDILAIADPADPRAAERLNRLLQRYWKPVYVFIRMQTRCSVEDAKDLTQAFFTRLLDAIRDKCLLTGAKVDFVNATNEMTVAWDKFKLHLNEAGLHGFTFGDLTVDWSGGRVTVGGVPVVQWLG